MNLNGILEIIISLVALFWLMSTSCSFIVEAANSLLLNIRAKALERFVCEMVLGTNQIPQLRYFLQFWRRSNLEWTKGTENSKAGTLADPLGLFSHGLIRALRKPQNTPGGEASPPSYIPARAFAQALLDRLLSLSWGMQAGATQALTVLDAMPLGAPWRQRLDAAKAGLGAGAPLLNAAVHLLKEIHHSPMSKARADLQALVVQLNSSATTTALQGLGNQSPVMPLLSGVDTTPTGFRDLVVKIVEAADSAIAALSESRTDPGDDDVSDLVSPEALWMLAVRKAGESIAHSPALMGTALDLVERAPLPMSLREALRPILTAANFDADKLREGIEVWYDSVMERATGWFKRYTTMWLGGVGLIAAVCLNVNTIRVAQDLAEDPALRHAGVAFAEFVVREQGRPQLAQQYHFSDRAEKARWKERIIAAQVQQTESPVRLCPPNSACELAKLFHEMSPWLLVSGDFFGPSMQVLQTSGRTGEWRPNQGNDVGEAVTFRKDLCRAALDRQTAINQDGAGTAKKESNSKLVATWEAQEGCKWVVQEFPVKGATKANDTGTFWESKNIVWHPGLGKAVRAAYELAAMAPPVEVGEIDGHNQKMTQALAALKTTFDEAQTQSKEVHEKAQAYLDRIPSLGRQGTAEFVASWLFPGGFFLCVIGWAITAVMVSFGASFWFDLLSKLVDRRATGPKPELTKVD